MMPLGQSVEPGLNAGKGRAMGREHQHIRCQRRFELGQIDQAIWFWLDKRRLKTLALQLANRVNNRFMFGGDGNDMFAFGVGVKVGRTFNR